MFPSLRPGRRHGHQFKNHNSARLISWLPASTHLIAIAITGVVLATGTATQAKVPPQPTTVDPVVLLKDGALEACGLKASYQTGSNRITVTVLGVRDTKATRFSLQATWSDLKQPDRTPKTISLQNETMDTAQLFPAPTPAPQGGIETTAELKGIEGARFIQSVMVGGASITLTDRAGSALKLDLPGPMPQVVRASYLNCSGDLFRPIGESRRDRGQP